MFVNLVVELFGPARFITKKKNVEVEVGEGANFRDVVVALLKEAPELLGQIIDADKGELLEPNMFFLNGRRAVRDFAEKPEPGDRISLLFAAVGG